MEKTFPWEYSHGNASGTSKPVSRVLSFKTAIYLAAPLPARSSHPLNAAGQACMRSHGVAPDRVYSDAPFPDVGRALTSAFPPLPEGTWRRSQAVYLCCTFPGVAPGGCYPLSSPCGARTFLTGGPFAPSARLSSLLAEDIVPDRTGVVKHNLTAGYSRYSSGTEVTWTI